MATVTQFPLRPVSDDFKVEWIAVAAAQVLKTGQIAKVVSGQVTARAAATDVQLVIMAGDAFTLIAGVATALAAGTLIPVWRVTGISEFEINTNAAYGGATRVGSAFGIPATDTNNISVLNLADTTNKRFKVKAEALAPTTQFGTISDTNTRVRVTPVMALSAAGTGVGDTGAIWF